MTPAEINALKLRMETARRDLNDSISAVNGAADEQRSELMGVFETREKAFQDLERVYGTAVKIQDSEQVLDDAEGREIRTIEGRVSLHKYLEASLSRRSVDGVEAEYNSIQGIEAGGPIDVFGAGDGTLVPLSLFAPRLEKRAKTDVDVTTRPSGWVDRLFENTRAAHLGIGFSAAPAGVRAFPLTKTGGTPAQRGRKEAAAAAAWTIGVVELRPSRMSIHLEIAVEDMARIAGLEAALRRDMRSALVERVDRTVFLGDDGANENSADIVGFFAKTGIGAVTISQTDKIKPAETLAAFVGLLDGKYAEGLGDLRAVSAVGWNSLVRSTIANSTASNDTIAKFLMDNGLSWRTRGGIESTTTSGKQFCAIGLGRGIQGAGQAVHWNAGMMVRDPYSAAASGVVKISLHTLWNWDLIRPENFAKITAA